MQVVCLHLLDAIAGGHRCASNLRGPVKPAVCVRVPLHHVEEGVRLQLHALVKALKHFPVRKCCTAHA